MVGQHEGSVALRAARPAPLTIADAWRPNAWTVSGRRRRMLACRVIEGGRDFRATGTAPGLEVYVVTNPII